MIILNTRVRQRRIACAMKQGELSRITGVGRSTISDLENGKSEPGIITALLIAKALHCRVEDIFCLEGEENQ